MKQKNIKAIFNFTKNFISNWFSQLPSYEGFLSRLNSLSKIFPELAKFILKNNKFKIPKTKSQPFILIDSLPIMLTTGFRAHKCNTANDISSIGYCSSKDKFYYGLKLHLAALFRNTKLASPIDFKITSAATHDLTAFNNDLLNFKHCQIFADRAYCDQSTKKNLIKINSKLHTPIKLTRRKKTLSSDGKSLF